MWVFSTTPISTTGTRSVGKRGVYFSITQGFATRFFLLSWVLSFLDKTHPDSALGPGSHKPYLEGCAFYHCFCDTSACLKYARWSALKKKKGPTVTSYYNSIWDWEGSVKSPREKRGGEKRPTEDLPGNNSSLSEESKGRSNETVCLNKWKDSSLLITEPPPWEARLGGTRAPEQPYIRGRG